MTNQIQGTATGSRLIEFDDLLDSVVIEVTQRLGIDAEQLYALKNIIIDSLCKDTRKYVDALLLTSLRFPLKAVMKCDGGYLRIITDVEAGKKDDFHIVPDVDDASKYAVNVVGDITDHIKLIAEENYITGLEWAIVTGHFVERDLSQLSEKKVNMHASPLNVLEPETFQKIIDINAKLKK